jgi:hypothetical protein
MAINLNQNQLTKISDILCDNIELLFDKLEVKLYKSGNGYAGRCPVHGGDNSHAIHLYPDGHTQRGYWKCVTHGCERNFKSTIIGFIRGVLSHQNHNWRKKGDKFESFDNTLKFISDTLKIDLNRIEISHEEIEKKKFLAQTRWNIPMAKDKPLIKRQDVQARLGNPPRYFIDRGFSPEILKKYDVGYCDDSSKKMYQRCVVPVYDEGYNYLVACLGRSVFEKCNKCKQYHNPHDVKCPKFESPKWKNSDNFNKKNSLYNYWFAKEHIKRSKTVILVESCGNVWRLEEAGIHNSVALFGCDLADCQGFLLEKVGVMNIVIIMDADDAGRSGTQSIIEKTKDFYNVKPIYLDTDDIASLSVDQIHKDIMPLL